ncbi:hypothetical protein ACIQ9P_22060 [Kitasatospora sp. NPDC094019]|uniref:hypothetical protein n=1 Tax=Kitasatospora sp. NPDC094019 TaxID=3364091 RepID=UPI0038266AC1
MGDVAAENDTARTAALLHEVARASSGLVVLDPGLSDAVLDGWPVPVPEEIRVLLRSVAGVRITVSRSPVNGHESTEHIDLVHPYNSGRYAGYDVGWYLEHAGGSGTHWFVHTDSGDGHDYVDVDRSTGAWGPVFRFWDATDTVRLAPSLPAWLDALADCLRAALAETVAGAAVPAGTEGAATVRAFGRSFTDAWAALDENTTDVATVTAAQATTGTDPLLREAAADLPADARLADLRAVPGPARVVFDFSTCRYARRAGGAVLIATEWEDA